MSLALSNLAGLTLSTLSASTSRCCDGNQLYPRIIWKIFALTLPLSHWTSNRPASSSSTTQPLMNAASESRSHRYLLPEKSFSPSIPPTVSSPLCDASLLMKVGAKVAEDWKLFLFELDLGLVGCGGASADPLSGENDWLRA